MKSKFSAAPSRFPTWLPALLLIVVIAGLTLAIWLINREKPQPVTPARNAAPATLPAEARSKIVGRWLRPDGGYVLTITAVGDDGTVAASYHNPQPINVARAQLSSGPQRPLLYVELRDGGYNGNNYRLVYDAERDQLVGTYQQVTVGQTFDVFFERLP